MILMCPYYQTDQAFPYDDGCNFYEPNNPNKKIECETSLDANGILYIVSI